MFVARRDRSRELTRAPRRTQRHQRRLALHSLPASPPERRRGSWRAIRLGPAFEPLRGRLTAVTERSRGRRNDALRRRRTGDLGVAVVARRSRYLTTNGRLIVGDSTRVDYAPLAEAIAARRQPMVLITMGEAGKRIGDEVTRLAPVILQIASRQCATPSARLATHSRRLVLLSPGAPSFDQ